MMEDEIPLLYEQELPYYKNQSPPEKGKLFIDSLFPPNDYSLIGKNENGEFIDKIDGEEKSKKINCSLIEWMRPKDIFKGQKYLLFEGKIEMEDSNQGAIGDCYFMASIAALSEYPNIIYQMFKTKEINEEGYFEVVFFIDGIPQIVIIDDYLPVYKKNKQICFSRPSKNQLFVCILEKAWAKINGGYTNIIKAHPHNALESITGYPCSSYIHSSYDTETIWEAISEAMKNNFIVTANSRGEVEKYGLSNNHAYTIISCKVINSKNKKIKLIEMRNPHGFKSWTGDWSNKSQLWGKEELSQVDLHINDDGVFYICAEDFFNFFSMTDICEILYHGYSKRIRIEGNDLNNGNIFNLYLENDGILSVSLIRKMWRFHRELHNTLLPSYLSIIKYDPNNKNYDRFFTQRYSKYESFENTFITKELTKGYYMIYTYHDLPHSTIESEDNYLVKFDSNSKFIINKMDCDSREDGFPLLREIFIQEYIYECEKTSSLNLTVNKKVITKYKRKELARKIYYNSYDKWLKITEDCSEMENMFILFPYQGKEDFKSFDWYIPPKSFNCILALVIDNKKQGYLVLESQATKLSKAPINYKHIKIDISEYANDEVANINENLENDDFDYRTISIEKAKEDLSFEILNMSLMTRGNIEQKYPVLMKHLLSLIPEPKNDIDLIWIEKHFKNAKYIGQMNKIRKREGRGAYIYNKSGSIYFGTFINGKFEGKTYIYEKDFKNIIFEGNFTNGKKNGLGKEYFVNGDIYEGEYINNKKNGHGVFYQKSSGSKWEGNFSNGLKLGEGILTDSKGNTKKVKYIHKKKSPK